MEGKPTVAADPQRVPSWATGYYLTSAELAILARVVDYEARSALCGVDRIHYIAACTRSYREYLLRTVWSILQQQRRQEGGAS